MSPGPRAMLLLAGAVVLAIVAALLGARLLAGDLVENLLMESGRRLRSEASSLLVPGATEESRRHAFTQLRARWEAEAGPVRLRAFRVLDPKGNVLWSSDPAGSWPEPPQPSDPTGRGTEAPSPSVQKVPEGGEGLRLLWLPPTASGKALPGNAVPGIQAIFEAGPLLGIQRALYLRGAAILLLGALALVLIALLTVQRLRGDVHALELGIEKALRGEPPATPTRRLSRPFRALQTLATNAVADRERGQTMSVALQTLFEHLEEGALLISPGPRVSQMGRRVGEVFGRRPGEDPSLFWEDFHQLNPDKAARLAEVLEGGPRVWKEITLVVPAHGRAPVEMIWSCFRTSDEPRAALVLFRPTAPIRAQEELRRAARRHQALLGFLGRASEDLGTPLASVVERAEGLRRDAEEGVGRAALLENLDILHGECRRAVRVLQAFAEVAGIPDEGARDEVDLADLLIESLHAMKPELEAQGKELAFTNDASDARVTGSRRLLKHGVVGMATFAAAIGGKGPVQFRLAGEETGPAPGAPHLCLEVACGPPPLTAEEREQAMGLLARGREGIIPGLASARFVAESHGGALHSRDGPGGVTIFTLRLPASG